MFRIKAQKCKACGDSLQGRSDKLFCDDRCRVQHHRNSSELHAMRIGVDQILRRNRALLADVRSKMHRQFTSLDCAYWLRRKGFNFDFHTHILHLADGRMAFMCYEEGYLLDGNGIVPWPTSSNHPKILLSAGPSA